MKITCSHCHAENDAGLKYCVTCGYALPVPEIQQQPITTKSEGKPKRTSKINMKTIIGIVIGTVFGTFISQYIFFPSVERQLSKAAEEVNQRAPVVIDQDLRLKSAEALPNRTFQYNYNLINLTRAEVKTDTVKKYLFPSVLQAVKTKPELKAFRDNDVTLIYNYMDKDDEFVIKYVITPDMYK
ncbi:zinc ribbon domain-containing protein [Flavobacterium pallidum]|uniref:Zinc-ribbon domain-containing protein n=1 Tax=Flavobacterium pallidum TaxID=2172098 RepID=A0A2S1SIA6_9FLAO|nr:zinc ribbon domain-containing protein [Flavobacterium pallidum]AWI26077.1 hypothetical protein HYN49_09300 [Flavobacterium pallidum]